LILDYSKQSELINTLEVEEQIHIIGCGALGSWIGFILLKMGFNNIHMYDFDTIEEHNIPNQLFMESQIGTTKTDAMMEIYKNFFIDADLRLTVHHGKLDEDSPILPGIIFCAVDTMSSRKELYEKLFKYSTAGTLWIEGRLSLYGAYVYTLPHNVPDMYTKYETTLYDDVEAELSACGVSQTALPSAINTATVMIMNMIEYINKPDGIYNELQYSIPWLDCIKSKW